MQNIWTASKLVFITEKLVLEHITYSKGNVFFFEIRTIQKTEPS